MVLAERCADDQIKKNEIGGACSTYMEGEGGDERCIKGFGGET